ncbi:MAG TPA: hydroxymethylglutaryl-CoA lyase [Burkholderiaceae bacterium]|nr:hydroxymethylglutaryl-CoA lyase [Burkholderiaceae bacterium]
MTLPKHVHLIDVGPRDGLQNEKTPIDTAIKIELIERLTAAGIRHLEAASFVSPKWVPQMADGAEVLAGVKRLPGATYAALVPNMKGLEGAQAALADEVVIFGAASEAFSQKNINCSIAESIERFRPVAEATLADQRRLRAAISCCLGCPYQGEVPIAAVVDVVQRLDDLGTQLFCIADTIGVGTPERTKRVIEAVAAVVGIERISGHFHDTYGTALANVYACLELGVSTFESSVSGLGGCPYAKGATGNVATEDVVYLMHGLGIETGVDLDALIDTGAWIAQAIGRPYAARAGRALLAKRPQPTA